MAEKNIPCTKTPFEKQGNDRDVHETDAQWYANNNGKVRGK